MCSSVLLAVPLGPPATRTSMRLWEDKASALVRTARNVTKRCKKPFTVNGLGQDMPEKDAAASRSLVLICTRMRLANTSLVQGLHG